MKKPRASATSRLPTLLRKIPFAVAIKRRLWNLFTAPQGATTLDIVSTFPAFAPNSAGAYANKAKLTIQTINATIPAVRALLISLQSQPTKITDIEAFPQSDADQLACSQLRNLMVKHGSDKAYHNYHFLYGSILNKPERVRSVLEIELGTNDESIVSRMGRRATPDASLRAFKEYLRNAEIYGADIDKRILFQEERVRTVFVDQTRPDSFEQLQTAVPSGLDLFIDDGLHSPDANITGLAYGLGKLRVGGWAVIEDIASETVPLWEVVSSLLKSRYRPYILMARGGFVFALQRLT